MCVQASLFTPPLLNYSLHLGPWVGFAVVPWARNRLDQAEQARYCLLFCELSPCARTASVFWRSLELPARESDENRIRDIKGVKLSAEECRKRTGKNIFGIGYDSCGDNGAMA